MQLSRNQTALIVALVLVIFAVISISFGVIFPQLKYNKLNGGVKFVPIPTVNSNITSEDGEVHNVSTDFSVELDSKYNESVNVNDLNTKIKDIMNKMSYESVIGEDNAAYIKDKIVTELSGQFPEEALKGIYITDINSGTYQFSTENNNSRGGNAVMKGLFKKIN